MNPSIMITAAFEGCRKKEEFALAAVKTAHAVFYRKKHKFYNRIC